MKRQAETQHRLRRLKRKTQRKAEQVFLIEQREKKK